MSLLSEPPPPQAEDGRTLAADVASIAGYILAVSYPVLALSTGVRAIYQLAFKPEVVQYTGAWLSLLNQKGNRSVRPGRWPQRLGQSDAKRGAARPSGASIWGTREAGMPSVGPAWRWSHEPTTAELGRQRHRPDHVAAAAEDHVGIAASLDARRARSGPQRQREGAEVAKREAALQAPHAKGVVLVARPVDGLSRGPPRADEGHLGPPTRQRVGDRQSRHHVTPRPPGGDHHSGWARALPRGRRLIFGRC